MHRSLSRKQCRSRWWRARTTRSRRHPQTERVSPSVVHAWSAGHIPSSTATASTSGSARRLCRSDTIKTWLTPHARRGPTQPGAGCGLATMIRARAPARCETSRATARNRSCSSSGASVNNSTSTGRGSIRAARPRARSGHSAHAGLLGSLAQNSIRTAMDARAVPRGDQHEPSPRRAPGVAVPGPGRAVCNARFDLHELCRVTDRTSCACARASTGRCRADAPSPRTEDRAPARSLICCSSSSASDSTGARALTSSVPASVIRAGRCSRRRARPVQSRTARSMAWLSSRTFPGHE